MEYQKISNLIGDDVESKFQMEEYVEVNDQMNNKYDSKQVRIKTNMLRSDLCDFSRAYIKVPGKVNFTGLTAPKLGRFAFKNCAPFTKCKLKINSTVIDNANFLNIIMPMYNLIEYSNNYVKTSGSLYNFARDEPLMVPAHVWTSPSALAKFKKHENYKTAVSAAGSLDKENDNITLIVPFTYISTFFRSFEVPLINCEV